MIWARRKTSGGGVLVPIETCADGRGDVALVAGMFDRPGDMMTAEVVTTRTRYRLHRDVCPGDKKARGAFSRGRQRKERPA